MSRAKAAPDEPRWLLLLHHIPRKPDYLRVKIWRRLQRLGAVPIKNAVYALPRDEERNEDLQWVIREIIAGGGEATVVEAKLVQGLSDGELEGLFNAARDRDYAEVRAALQEIEKRARRRGKLSDAARKGYSDELKAQRLLFDAIAAVDFFSTSGGEVTRAKLDELEAALTPVQAPARPPIKQRYEGRTWVTRKGIFVDRIASAWLIRRFIDPQARFKFVAGKGYVPHKGELRFDMFEAEFTHIGDRCTFEVLLEAMDIADPALRPLAEIVHDIDIKDGKFNRPEARGIEHLLAGIALRSDSDDERLARGSTVFDDLYEVGKRRRRS